MTDNVKHPPHYNSSPAHCACGRRIECIDVTRHMGFALGNTVKYLWRYQLKNGVEDLKKARWYLDDLIKQLEKPHPMSQLDRIDVLCGIPLNPNFELPKGSGL